MRKVWFITGAGSGIGEQAVNRFGRIDVAVNNAGYAAGSDALTAITPAIEERLKVTRAYEELSKSTDGWFENKEK